MKKNGFTIIEITIIVVILAIISTIAFVSYGSWRSNIAQVAVKSDLKNAYSVMESSRTFLNGYPANLPSSFTPSKNVSVSIIRSSSSSYCIEATNSESPDVTYYIDTSVSPDVKQGSCGGLSTSPQNFTASVTSADSISLSWDTVSGATGYNIIRSTNAVFSGYETINIPSGSTTSHAATGLDSSTKYFFKIRSVDSDRSSAWSDVAFATTSDLAIAAPTMTAPTFDINSPLSTQMYTTFYWSEVSCGVGSQAVYRYEYLISNGYDSGWVQTISKTVKFTTINDGLDYSLSVQAKCKNEKSSSSWSDSAVATYHRPRKWFQIYSGPSFTCGIGLNDRKAYCWGSNTYGQLGNGTTTNSSVPVPVDATGVLAGKTIKYINTGNYNACVIASDDKVYCWGRNQYGILGDNTQTQRLTPVAVYTGGVLNGKTIKQLAVGSYHSCVIASDDLVYCWGQDANYGSLGYGSIVYSVVPVAVIATGDLAGKTITKVTTGYYNTCVIASDNLEYCWGRNNMGQLGFGTTTDQTSPKLITMTGALAGLTIKSISLGNYHNCAIASNDKAYCWGLNSGRLGDDASANSSVPVAVYTSGLLNGKTVKTISATYYHTCAIASDNNIYCWGVNTSGQLGNGNTTASLVPAATTMTGVLSGKTPVSSLTTGVDADSCVIGNDSLGYCWGANGSGQIGNNTTVSSSVPVVVY